MADRKDADALTRAGGVPIADRLAQTARDLVESQGVVDLATVADVQSTLGPGDEIRGALRRLGVEPTTEPPAATVFELETALSGAESTEQGAAERVELLSAAVDVTARTKYDFDLEAASRVTVKIVPVPRRKP